MNSFCQLSDCFRACSLVDFLWQPQLSSLANLWPLSVVGQFTQMCKCNQSFQISLILSQVLSSVTSSSHLGILSYDWGCHCACLFPAFAHTLSPLKSGNLLIKLKCGESNFSKKRWQSSHSQTKLIIWSHSIFFVQKLGATWIQSFKVGVSVWGNGHYFWNRGITIFQVSILLSMELNIVHPGSLKFFEREWFCKTSGLRWTWVAPKSRAQQVEIDFGT